MGGEQNAVRAGSAAVIRDSEGRILIGRRAVKPIGIWVLPGGGIDFGETSEEAVVREVREETGLEIRPLKLIKVHELIDMKNMMHRIIFFYLAEAMGGEMKPSGDMGELRWLTLDEIDKLDNLGDTVKPVLDRLRQL